MRHIGLTMLAAMMLASCGEQAPPPSTLPAPPAAGSTTIDTKILIGVENAYKAARLTADLAVTSGKITGADADNLATADRAAFFMLQRLRIAADTGNVADYVQLATTSIALVKNFANLANGGVQ